MKRLAVCPGSYDPITEGHMDLIRRATQIFGRCEVVVMNNRSKTYRFSLEERYRFCLEAFSNEEGITVSFYEGMLYEFLQEREGAVLVKGIRNETDYLYEREMAAFNFAHSGVETLYLDAREEYRTLSSTVVREKMDRKDDLSAVVPENVVKFLQNKM